MTLVLVPTYISLFHHVIVIVWDISFMPYLKVIKRGDCLGYFFHVLLKGDKKRSSRQYKWVQKSNQNIHFKSFLTKNLCQSYQQIYQNLLMFSFSFEYTRKSAKFKPK